MLTKKQIEEIRGPYETRKIEYQYVYSLSRINGLDEKMIMADLGAGDRGMGRYLKEIGNDELYLAYDKEYNRKSGGYLDLDELPLKFKNKTFTWGFCIETLEHCIDPIGTVKELKRVCGNLTIAVPTDQSKVKDYKIDPTHIAEMNLGIVKGMGFEKIYLINTLKCEEGILVDNEEQCNIIIAIWKNQYEPVYFD